MGEWWAVACRYQLINRCIAGAMKILAWNIYFDRVRVNSARMLLRSALSQGQVSIWQKDYQYIQIIMKTIIDGSWCWVDNILTWVSTERQWFGVCKDGNCTTVWPLWCITDMLAAFIGKWDSEMLHAAFREWAWTECRGVLASRFGWFIFRLVVDIHLADIVTLYWKKPKRHAPCHILRMSVNRAWTMFSFASWVIYVLIGCRHPFVWYWQPLLGKTTATCSLPHPENERQWSVNDFQLLIFGNLSSAWL